MAEAAPAGDSGGAAPAWPSLATPVGARGGLFATGHPLAPEPGADGGGPAAARPPPAPESAVGGGPTTAAPDSGSGVPSSTGAAASAVAGGGESTGAGRSVPAAVAARLAASAASARPSGVWFSGAVGTVEFPPPPSVAELAHPQPPPPPDPPPSPPTPPAAFALRRSLLELLNAQPAHTIAPAQAGLWTPPTSDGAAAAGADADALALPLVYLLPPSTDTGAIRTPADGTHCPASFSPVTWRALLRGEAQATLRELSHSAHVAARARIYHELPLWKRAGSAACQGDGAAVWLSALPTPGIGGTEMAGAAMRVAVPWRSGVPQLEGAWPLSCGQHTPGGAPKYPDPGQHGNDLSESQGDRICSGAGFSPVVFPTPLLLV